jgi:tyrosyl-tRNA synthetase
VFSVVDFLIYSKLVKSKREAKDLITSGGIYFNGIRVTENREVSTDDLIGDEIVLRKGKKTHFTFKFLNVKGY